MIRIDCPAADNGIRVLRNEASSIMSGLTSSLVIPNQGSPLIGVTSTAMVIVGTESADITSGAKYVRTYSGPFASAIMFT